MTDEGINNENYEQMSVGSGDAPEPLSNKKNKINKNNNFSKNKINIFFILIIIILGIYYIYKLSYSFSLSEQINQFQNEINILSKK